MATQHATFGLHHSKDFWYEYHKDLARRGGLCEGKRGNYRWSRIIVDDENYFGTYHSIYILWMGCTSLKSWKSWSSSEHSEHPVWETASRCRHWEFVVAWSWFCRCRSSQAMRRCLFKEGFILNYLFVLGIFFDFCFPASLLFCFSAFCFSALPCFSAFIL